MYDFDNLRQPGFAASHSYLRGMAMRGVSHVMWVSWVSDHPRGRLRPLLDRQATHSTCTSF